MCFLRAFSEDGVTEPAKFKRRFWGVENCSKTLPWTRSLHSILFRHDFSCALFLSRCQTTAMCHIRNTFIVDRHAFIDSNELGSVPLKPERELKEGLKGLKAQLEGDPVEECFVFFLSLFGLVQSRAAGEGWIARIDELRGFKGWDEFCFFVFQLPLEHLSCGFLLVEWYARFCSFLDA